MKKLLTVLVLLFFQSLIFSQNACQDWAVLKNGDTIYGTFRGRDDAGEFYENSESLKMKNIKFKRYKLRKLKSYTRNNKIFNFQKPEVTDGIYAKSVEEKDNDSLILTKHGNFVHQEKRLHDYVVIDLDTIYGEIFRPVVGRKYIVNKAQQRIKIELDSVSSYRENNTLFFQKKIKGIFFFKKEDYMELLVDGKVKLFRYYITHLYDKRTIRKKFYLIEDETASYYLNKLNYTNLLREALTANNDVIAKINSRFYTYNNIYLAVRCFNEKFSKAD